MILETFQMLKKIISTCSINVLKMQTAKLQKYLTKIAYRKVCLGLSTNRELKQKICTFNDLLLNRQSQQFRLDEIQLIIKRIQTLTFSICQQQLFCFENKQHQKYQRQRKFLNQSKKNFLKKNTQQYSDLQNRNQLTINQRIQKLSFETTEMVLSKCTLCTQKLIKGTQLDRQNQLCIGIKSKYLADQDFLQKNICSLANRKCGVIMIGMDEKYGTKIEGHGFKYEQKMNIERILGSIMKKMSKKIQVQIDYIPVIDQQSDKIEQKQKLYCARIYIKNIKNLEYNKLSYLKICHFGHQSNLQFYHFRQNKPQPIQSQQIYNQIIKQFNTKNNLSFHYDGKCCLTAPKINFSQSPYQQPVIQGIYAQDKISEITPKFIYKNSSLMIVGSQKKTLFIKKFLQTLKNEKIVYSDQKVFDPIAKNCGKRIFFISHEEKPEIIKQLLNKYDKGKNIRFIPMQKCIRIPDQIISDYQIEKFKLDYSSIFPKKQDQFEHFIVNATMSDGNNKLCHFFRFNDYTSAILGQIIFEVMGIKPFILKYVPQEGKMCKKIQYQY